MACLTVAPGEYESVQRHSGKRHSKGEPISASLHNGRNDIELDFDQQGPEHTAHERYRKDVAEKRGVDHHFAQRVDALARNKSFNQENNQESRPVCRNDAEDAVQPVSDEIAVAGEVLIDQEPAEHEKEKITPP